MSNRKLAQRVQRFLDHLWQPGRRLAQKIVRRGLYASGQPQSSSRRSNAGFVLPTTVLLILVVALTVGALTLRAFNRNSQVIGDAQQRTIYNAATPAIDRARGKLEFMFDSTKDTRYPGAIPGEDYLYEMMINDGTGDVRKLTLKDGGGNDIEPYTLPDEKRVDLNGDSKVDNSWSYRSDTNNDGKADATVIYSVIFQSPKPAANSTQSINELLLSMKDSAKANQLLIRHGPLSNDLKAIGCGSGAAARKDSGLGWFESKTSTALLRKNFQVDALVIPDNVNATAVTLEFHQDRQVNRGNKWGAWFRTDLDITPGPPFNWNGAMHTEGSLVAGSTGTAPSFTAHLISSPASCVFEPPSNSDITITKWVNKTTQAVDYQGVAMSGGITNDDLNQAVKVYIHDANPIGKEQTLTAATDSVKDTPAYTPSQVLLNPATVITKDKNENSTGGNNVDRQTWDTFKNTNLGKRIRNVSQEPPYVDDLYRADDRWGPKYRYNSKFAIPDGVKVGTDISKSDPKYAQLVLQDPAGSEDFGGVGLDGYWERRARVEGMRILVGERLELGNLHTWVTPQDTNNDNYINPVTELEGDPLYPPTVKPYPVKDSAARLRHVDLQRRSLRDNLSAAQATAIYHAAVEGNKDYPVACFASTVHPGTPSTLRNAINFVPFPFKGGTAASGFYDTSLQTNFFTGRGTNGWEFETPAGSATNFASAMNDANSSLRIALTNLANFAGDWDNANDTGGAYPPTQETGNNAKIHPYPALSMWGNFSNLKRVLDQLNSGTTYTNLSIADKTYLQTASCTLGMLAYNIDQIQQMDIAETGKKVISGNETLLSMLAGQLYTLMDGQIDTNNFEVLPKGQLATYGNDVAGAFTTANYQASDYDAVPPEAFIGVLKRQIETTSYATSVKREVVQLAEAILLKHQIRRDRTFGFKSSPAFGEYIASFGGKRQLFPVACDPNQFTFSPTPSFLASATEANYKLALAKLCGGLDTQSYSPNLAANYQTSEPGIAGSRAVVRPKFPSLYYLFPERDHGLRGDFELKVDTDTFADKDGEYEHNQPTTEPYVGDAYITSLLPITDKMFRVVQSTDLDANKPRIRPTVAIETPSQAHQTATFPTTSTTVYTTPRRPDPQRTVFPVPDLPVNAISLQPRSIGNWKLPNGNPQNITSASVSGGPNLSPNRIVDTDGNIKAVPFLDRAIFNGRQSLVERVLDLDLALLRNTKAGNDNVWLPQGGVVYAFREDAVREDTIARPGAADVQCQSNYEATANCMDLRDPANPKDPRIDAAVIDAKDRHGITIKQIDFRPDPDRRSHGFRLRNGSQVKRKDGLLDQDKNIRGLSFFTDQPVYIQGDFNLHQNGTDDTAGTRLEEFKELLPTNAAYTAAQFYTNRVTRDDTFAVPNVDRWRPSEILADSVSILSADFCDGSIADTFVMANTNSPDFTLMTNTQLSQPTANRSAVYHTPTVTGLFGPGCSTSGYTSFNNQNRPSLVLPNAAANTWDWLRENALWGFGKVTLPAADYWADLTTPVKISRSGQPLIAKRQVGTTAPTLANVANYDLSTGNGGIGGTYLGVDRFRTTDAMLTPGDTRVNSIIVSGIHPARKFQSAGGLHNFPRFIENWTGKKLFFSGALLQLNFSTYATAPFETESWEPGQAANPSPTLSYYWPPDRFWGYDVALQLSPAGPAASRFVAPDRNRSEFYSELPINDPYINKLCTALKNSTDLLPTDTKAKLNCPSQQS